jgi:transcriptional regulator with XRE-family HTH domain
MPEESIGERIKALRVGQGKTLSDLGERANLSISYLSQIERDKTTPSISTLTSIAKALDVGLRYFFETEAETAVVVRRGEEGVTISSDTRAACQPLTPEVGETKLDVCRITLPPHAPSESLPQRAGEELAFVLSGELTITIGDEQFLLSAGDSVHYNALEPHCWQNFGSEPCAVIWSHAIPWSEHQS